MQNELTVKKIVELCKGELFCGDETIICKSFTKDTRTIQKGDVYIGIKGEKFDGNSFYEEAFLKGARVCILERGSFKKVEKGDKTIILVENTIEALKDLAIFKRDNTEAFFVGVTGSVGKTSTRDMIYSVLKEKFKTLKTEGNYNNNIGLPLTLLRLEEEKAAVIEMGMNALGEIDYLSHITKPHISVITNVGTAHIGELGSRENILKAKLEIKNGMDDTGILVLNNDNDLLHAYYEENKKNVVTIGIQNKSDFFATDVELLEDCSTFNVHYHNQVFSAFCPVPGIAFVYNSLVAIAVGIFLKMDIEDIRKGIKNFSLTKNRLEIFTNQKGITVINDSYNASVDSMKSSLEILKNRSEKRKIAVLGTMLELGDFSEDLHKEVGSYVSGCNIDILVTVGEDALYIAESAKDNGMLENTIFSFQKNEEAIFFLKEFLNAGDVVLLKASNGLRFIEIVESLKDV